MTTPRISTTYLLVSAFTNATVNDLALSVGLVNVLPERVAVRLWVQPTPTAKLRRPLPEGVESFIAAAQAIWVPDTPGPGWDSAEDALTGLREHWSTHLPTKVGEFGIPGDTAPLAVFPIDAETMVTMTQACRYLTVTSNPPDDINLNG